jgi:hypothetical protein
MEEVVAIDEITGGEVLLHDVLSNDAEDPGTQAARKMDWELFMAGLTEREQAVIECLVEGRSLRDVAHSFQVCDSTLQGDKRSLAVKIQDFMGFDILIQVRKSPRWKEDIMSSRERVACRYDRCSR